MISIEGAVLNYEKSRQLVTQLTSVKSGLTGDCPRMKADPHDHPCLIEAYEFMKENREYQKEPYYEFVSYEDALFNAINDEEGCCDSCKASYELKHGDLAKAKKDFGISKCQLSAIGKKLIGDKI